MRERPGTSKLCTRGRLAIERANIASIWKFQCPLRVDLDSVIHFFCPVPDRGGQFLLAAIDCGEPAAKSLARPAKSSGFQGRADCKFAVRSDLTLQYRCWTLAI